MPTSTTPVRRRRRLTLVAGLLAALSLLAAACGSSDDADDDASSDAGSSESFEGTLRVSAIPDQDPEKLQRTYDLVADYLEGALPGITVEYVPVTDYQGAVAGFRTGDLDLVWFGGLSGVQARNEVEGSVAIAQRDIDENFTSVFIASADAGIDPFTEVDGLTAVAGKSFTFGSESSTSGRLMPQFFMTEAGVDVESDLKGDAGFSGAHDKTIELVAAGTYEVGALNSSVWDTAVEDGTVDPTTTIEIFRTPEYYDYHWVAQPDLDDTFGDGFEAALEEALLALDGSDDAELEILDLFGAGSFIATDAENYASIEATAKDLGLIR